jgi:ketosteroid isomerase-like protein
MVARTMARLRAGDATPTLKLDADDVWLRFPGDSSWSGDIRGRTAHGEWLDRFIQVGLQIFPDEVMVRGWPWRMTLIVRGHIFLDDHGRRPYDNRYVMWGTLAWGRLSAYEVYEDTQKSAALDRYLEAHGSAV